MTKSELKNYAVRLLADIFYTDGTRQKYIYNMTLIDIDSKNNNPGSKVALYLFIFVPIICVIVVVAVLIYLKKKNKEKDINDEVENDSLLPKDNI